MKKILKISTLLFALMLIVSSCGQTEEEYAKAKDHNGAIRDYTKAIELDPNDANAYYNRGVSKENLGDLNGACADWKKAAALGHKNAAKWVAKQCN